MGDLGCAADLPEDWFPLPLEEEPDSFGRRFAETVSHDLRAQEQVELSSDHIADLAADIAAFSRHARELGAVFAAVHLPDPAGPVVAMLECLAVDSVSAGWSADRHELAGQVGAPDATVASSEVTEVDLAAGPAVRVHEVTAVPAPDDGGTLQGTAVEKVLHYLPVPAQEATVVLAMSWTALALAEELVPMADGIAATLEVSAAG